MSGCCEKSSIGAYEFLNIMNTKLNYKTCFLFAFTLLIIILVITNIPFLNNKLEATYYDFTNSNPPIHKKSALEKILNGFETIPLNQLPPKYLKQTKMKEAKYKKMVASMKFFKITKKETYRKIIGDLRILDFIVKDHQLLTAYRSSKPIYWGMNRAVLYKLFELKEILESRNLDFNAITINSGHRTPHINEKVGGASKSRHIVGEAIDLKIGDVDKDGKITIEDKNQVLKICDLELIKNEGGVGKYPGTRVIHIDTRGYRARWDTY